MQLTLTFPVSLGLLLVLLAGAHAQDIRPEFPVDFPRPTEEGTTGVVTEEPTTPSPTGDDTTEAPTEEATSAGSPEEAATPASTENAMSAGSAEEPTTTKNDQITTTTTEAPKTTTTTEAPKTTTTTEASKTTTTTEAHPPTYIPPYAPPTISNRPTSTTKNPWILNEPAERCYLRDQRDYGYRNGGCGPWGWRSTISCYRCCYFAHRNVAGCSKIHRGRCGYH
ncbi:cell wall protein SED1 [Drosophila pseudoobscura]|uniref:Cell wall protein SED1 n=1 Tax=Drosophila pseudoobscura pseudoobscura TaxID=46245 RepID=A0A6I8V4W6_DROPS|nr:cell wall protein SED1 [Drosophila pseudoobscura]